MDIIEFGLERIQSLYENTVEYNLSDSGVHPYSLRELLSQDQIEKMLDFEIGYGWTNGTVELRNAVAKLYRNRDADQVIVTNGSAEANFLMVMALLDADDELIVVVPNYLQIWGWAKSLGIKVVEVKLHENLGWQPDLNELEKAITPKTRMITICHPNNPTGSVMPAETMGKLVDLARAHGLYLHADEVYKGSELNGIESPSFADLYEKSIVTSGLSKALALPGLRIGWLVGPADIIYKAWQCKDYTSITTSAISEYVAQLVLQPQKRAQILQRSRKILTENVTMLDEWLTKNGDFFSSILPKAGGMAFVRYRMDINSTSLVHQLREERSIMLVPGDVYGMDGYVRLGVGAPKDHIAAGLSHLADFARAFR